MNSEDRRLVLIIRNSTNMYGLRREVLRNNFQVLESNSAEYGLELAKQTRPDLVLCDISSSSLGGLTICSKLKSDIDTRHVSIILLGPLSRQIDALRAGADDYILLPFDSHVLRLKIENMIRLRDAMRSKLAQEISTPTESKEVSDQFLDKLEQLVLENIADADFGVHKIAFQIGISVSVLYRKLRLITGLTVNDFVKAIRMKRAMKMLEMGIYPVNEVAAAIGYEDSKYFSKEFRKFFGKTPTDVKRRTK
ncbi:helix-turn-helix domain-containing protein [Dyadobacter sp. BHUBP1]|uniref:helix-turn-helix domain-containing protein n=1 Tax=Dyadobacter sp. BHUBP1 TaxID=3424178 RepID=UPI003D345F4C